MKRLLATALALSAGLASAQISSEILALSGTPAPDAIRGEYFDSFGVPYINNAGEVAFEAILSDATGGPAGMGIWMHTDGQLRKVVQTDEPLPGMLPDHRFDATYINRLSDNGSILYFGHLTGDGISNMTEDSIWLGNATYNQLVYQGGYPMPGQTDPVALIWGADINASGKIFAKIAVDNGPDQLLVGDADGFEIVAQTFDTVQPDGTKGDVRYSVFEDIEIADSGHVSFLAQLHGTNIDHTNNAGFWSGSPDEIRLLARESHHAPGTDPGVYFDGFGIVTYDNVYRHQMNNYGVSALRGSVLGPGITNQNNLGFWVGTPADFNPILRKGDSASGAPSDSYFSYLREPKINDQGSVLIDADIEGPLVNTLNEVGLWLARNGEIVNIMLEGMPAHGLNDQDAEIDRHYSRAFMNNNDQITFRVLLRGGNVVYGNETALYFADEHQNLYLVARKGDAIDVNPDPAIEDNRVILDIVQHPLVGRNTMNDLGQVAYLLRFTDESEGVFVSTFIPPCLADVNGDGQVTPTDFNAWINALNNTLPACDQNGDGQCMPTDFNAWIANFNAGCN